MRRALAMILAIVMAFAILPTVVFADSSTPADDVFVTIDGVVYRAHQGEIIDYVYYLCTGEQLCSLEGKLYFSPEGLELVPEKTEDLSLNQQIFPRIGTAVVSHIYQPGTMAFNFSNADGVSFKNENAKLIETQFRVTAASGSYELNTTLFVVCGANEKKYLYKGEIVNPLVRQESAVPNKIPYDPNATEPDPTEPPTEAPTAPPTEPVTEDPTAPPTEPPTEAPAEPANGVGSDGYYRVDGVIRKSAYLVKVEDDYYFVLYTGKVLKDADRNLSADSANGLLPAGTYHFGPDGKMSTLLNGIDEEGYYRVGGVLQKSAYLVEIDGDYYFVLSSGKVLKDADRTLNSDTANSLLPAGTYHFGPDGKMTTTLVTGTFVNKDGYYCVDGAIQKSAYLVKVDNDYYFVLYNGKVLKDADRNLSAETANGLLPAGTYHFGPDGKMTTILNGIDEEGYYRIDGVLQKGAYLVKVDNDYYFILYNGKTLKDADRTLSAETANGLLPGGTYHFGPDGKMTNVSIAGPFVDKDGYYRVGGEIQKAAYLVKVGSDYYFVVYTGKVLRDSDRSLSSETAHNLVPAGNYHFGPDGKMTNPPAPVQETANGVGSDGYYRVNGEIRKSAYLVKVGDDYYFVVYTGKVLRDSDRSLSSETAHNLVPAGTYHFGPDGKMTNPPAPLQEPANGVGSDGYYRVNGEIRKSAYLVKVEEDYYFVLYTGKVLKNADRNLSAETANGLLPAGTYHFGPDGKMTTVLDGIDDTDGYYRVGGVIQKGAYLTEIDGDYYFVLSTGKILKDADRTLSNATANGLVPAGTYHFGPDGRMVVPA